MVNNDWSEREKIIEINFGVKEDCNLILHGSKSYERIHLKKYELYEAAIIYQAAGIYFVYFSPTEYVQISQSNFVSLDDLLQIYENQR